MAKVISSFERELDQKQMPAGKKKVLKAATHLFSEQGFSATTTAQIAKAAGVSEGTIYKYFASKQTLLNELLTPMFIKIRDTFFTQASDYQSLDDFIAFVVKNRIQFGNENFELIKIIFQEMLTSQRNDFGDLEKLLTGSGGLYDKVDHLKKAFPEINQQLPPEQIVQIFIGPILGYLIQTRLMGVHYMEPEKVYESIGKEIKTALISQL